jgi:TolB-like protein
VPRRGYRFVGEVCERTAPAAPAVTADPAGPVGADSKQSLRPLWVSAAAVALLVAIGTFLVQRGRDGHSSPPAIQTVAVLPFKPLLPTERDESLELGMTESLIASLGARPGLTIRPLSSVRRYGSIEQDPLEAGRALLAESVLDGSLRRNGDQLRVSVRLLRVADGRQLWAHQFDGNVTGTTHDLQALSIAWVFGNGRWRSNGQVCEAREASHGRATWRSPGRVLR